MPVPRRWAFGDETLPTMETETKIETGMQTINTVAEHSGAGVGWL